MANSHDRNLLDHNAIRNVLSGEGTIDGFNKQRGEFQATESTLASNLECWITDDLESLQKRFPDIVGDRKKWVAHLLQRYFIRGFMMHRKATVVQLENAFELEAPDPSPPEENKE